MASTATNHTPGRVARGIQAILPTLRWAFVLIASDLALGLAHAPLWAHAGVGVLLHLAAHMLA